MKLDVLGYYQNILPRLIQLLLKLENSDLLLPLSVLIQDHLRLDFVFFRKCLHLNGPAFPAAGPEDLGDVKKSVFVVLEQLPTHSPI